MVLLCNVCFANISIDSNRDNVARESIQVINNTITNVVENSAQKEGIATQTFMVATPTSSTHAVNKGILPTYELSTGSVTIKEISSWTREVNDFPNRNSHTMCTFDNKMWVIGGNNRWLGGTNAEVKYSTDGQIWTIATTTAAFGNVFAHSTVVFDNKMWVIGGSNLNQVWSSTNGINWSLESTIPVNSVYKPAVVYDNRIYVLTSPVYSSSDGVNWVSSGTNAPWHGLEFYSANCAAVFNGKMWIGGAMGATGNKIWSSTNGSDWTESSSIRTTWWGGILFEYADRLWAYGGQYHPAGPGVWSTDIWSSYDGVNWEVATSATWVARNSPAYTEYDGKLWISGGYSEVITTTDVYSLYIASVTDDIPETVTIPASIILTKPLVVATPTLSTHAANKAYVLPVSKVKMPGRDWNIISSITSPLTKRRDHTTLLYDGKMWMIGGIDTTFTNSVLWSYDGIEWNIATTTPTFGNIYRHSSVVFDNKMWVIGGSSDQFPNTGNVWWSTDGITWTLTTEDYTFGGRYGHTSVVFDNKMWVIGGHGGEVDGPFSDVWWSTDGITWTFEGGYIADLTFEHTSVIYDNKMWVIGGQSFSSNIYCNSIQWSSDGITWNVATNTAAFGNRYAHTSVVFDNKMWVIGGYDGSYKNDVWYSSDGIIWSCASTSAAFSARGYHSSVVYDNKIWMFGGMDASVRSTSNANSYLMIDY